MVQADQKNANNTGPRPLPSSSPYHLATRGLLRAIRETAERELAGRKGLRLLDVGCGPKPYRAWFEPYCDSHVGVDGYAGPAVDHVASAEALPLQDGGFDVVLCTQVLQHVDDPSLVCRELYRVLAPGGLCLLSTHGTFIYHPHPVDHWRWTGPGLEKLFRKAGFEDVRVGGTEGIASSIGCLLAFYSVTFCQRVGWLRWLADFVARPFAWTAPGLDKYLAWTFPDHPLPVNFLVVARKVGPPPGT